MEWLPKLLDNLDSAAVAAHQAWAGYMRWVALGCVFIVLAISVIAFSPLVRLLALAAVLTYLAAEALDLLVRRLVVPRRAVHSNS